MPELFLGLSTPVVIEEDRHQHTRDDQGHEHDWCALLQPEQRRNPVGRIARALRLSDTDDIRG